MACSTVRISAQQNGRRENGSRNYQPDKTQQEEAVITAVREFDGELAQKIIDEMFLFENLVDVDDRSIQRLLRKWIRIAVDRAERAEQPLREKFLQYVAACRRILRHLANRGPVRLSQVENERKRFC